MKKAILNLGEVLNKNEQQKINGGIGECDTLYFGITESYCQILGGNYIIRPHGNRCLVTNPGCNTGPFLP